MVSADETAIPSADWIELNWKLARAKGAGTLLVIDEIQKIPNWSQTVKRWKDFINHSIIEPVLLKDLLSVLTVHKPALFR